jgi:hypothetical protein
MDSIMGVDQPRVGRAGGGLFIRTLSGWFRCFATIWRKYAKKSSLEAVLVHKNFTMTSLLVAAKWIKLKGEW